MSVSANALRELHRLHRQVADLESRLRRGPQQVKASKAHLNRLTQTCNDVKASLLKTRLLADEKQLQLREREGKIEDLRAKLNVCGSNREYQALAERIAADEQANSVLSDEILEALERMDEQQEALEGADTERKKAEGDLKELSQRVEAEQEGLQAELDRVNRELQEDESALPTSVREDYLRIARARGEDALAPVDDQNCGGCFHVLSPQTLNELAMNRIVFCKSCGALLYLPEGHGIT